METKLHQCSKFVLIVYVKKNNHSLVWDNVFDEDELDDEVEADSSEFETAKLNLGVTCIDLRW